MAHTRSPFPGMDPYLERHWLDVHGSLIAEIRKTLNHSLPDGLVARMEERIAIDSDEDSELHAGPDVFVYSPSSGPWNNQSARETVAIEAPFKMVVILDPIKERSVRISNDGQLITVIELISPSNKRKPGIKAYRAKRAELLDAGVHIVEIDLLRAGNWKALFKPHTCITKAITLYRVTVRTAEMPPPAYVYPIRLQDVLPEIQIPLRKKDSKLMMALQQMIETVYADGRYGSTLDYTRPLDPPLTAEDQLYTTQKLTAGR